MSPKKEKRSKVKTVTPEKKSPKKEKRSKVKTVTPEKQSPKKEKRSKIKTVTPEKKSPKKTKRTKKVTSSKISKLSMRKKAIRNKKKNTPDTLKILKRRRIFVPKKSKTSHRGCIYLSHVPHGFYETELKQFFGQFGKVTAVRVPRSTRTGRFKGYAFVEFLYPDVAKIAAETMNNYLMYKKVLKAKCLPPEEHKQYVFKFPRFQVPLRVRRKRVLRKESNRELSETECKKEMQRLENCVQKKLNKLKKMGINYEFQVAKTANDTNEQEVSS